MCDLPLRGSSLQGSLLGAVRHSVAVMNGYEYDELDTSNRLQFSEDNEMRDTPNQVCWKTRREMLLAGENLHPRYEYI